MEDQNERRFQSGKSKDTSQEDRLERRQGGTDSAFGNPPVNVPFTPDTSQHNDPQSPNLPQTASRLGDSLESERPLSESIVLTAEEASLYNHYNVHLGRWMDCTNASRLLTLRVSEMARHQLFLHHAVICFASRHKGDHQKAGDAYHKCITLLIPRLEQNPGNDEALLTAVILLHFADQLSVQSNVGMCDKSHLQGSSGILRASQLTRFIDPSAPTVREAVFWVYVRQSLYNATIRQQPLDLDFSLQLEPLADAVGNQHRLDALRRETAWANQMLWHTACVANFCFADTGAQSGQAGTTQRWQALWTQIRTWRDKRPSSFDPIWAGPSTDEDVFPDIFFTADWHVISFTFYHFASILLLTYTPGPKFGMRIIQSEESRLNIIKHAEAICSASNSSPQNPQLYIIVCHTVFIWGPLLSNSAKRQKVIYLLETFQNSHFWGTSWIVSALKTEWGIE
ncbi:hypothetical protein IAQ61_008026 [Plenodomus lingam]|uniref:Predicted protein n=1 Tax=Leptosphaeria maculans (strain JN3 / isolate v23.1.3 / race Av1-4-5-6-7-8) TaxID=985895 RepID=E5A0G8_LEPMJ|nr:predicted protein [Plenodomus lingam JN3]KAH9867433.1 hypothetical protein IAQ61_008026 [Plenodomus lingam]CBX97028.1 predicted protein [Plenodomus lingam JN3]